MHNLTAIFFGGGSKSVHLRKKTPPAIRTPSLYGYTPVFLAVCLWRNVQLHLKSQPRRRNRRRMRCQDRHHEELKLFAMNEHQHPSVSCWPLKSMAMLRTYTLHPCEIQVHSSFYWRVQRILGAQNWYVNSKQNKHAGFPWIRFVFRL